MLLLCVDKKGVVGENLMGEVYWNQDFIFTNHFLSCHFFYKKKNWSVYGLILYSSEIRNLWLVKCRHRPGHLLGKSRLHNHEIENEKKLRVVSFRISKIKIFLGKQFEAV